MVSGILDCSLSVVYQFYPRNTHCLGYREEKRCSRPTPSHPHSTPTLFLRQTYQNHPYVWFRFQKHLSFSVCMHSLTQSVGVEGLGEVHQCLAQPDVAHLPVQHLVFWVVIEYLLILLDPVSEKQKCKSTHCRNSNICSPFLPWPQVSGCRRRSSEALNPSRKKWPLRFDITFFARS